MSNLGNTGKKAGNSKVRAKTSIEQLIREFEQAEGGGHNRRALEIGREIVSLKPAMMHGHYAMGSAMCSLGMLDEADTALKKAIAREPGRAGLYSRHAEVLNRLGHRDLAIETIGKARKLAPEDPKIMVTQAIVLRLGGLLNEAYSGLDEAIKGGCTDPNLRSVHASLAGRVGRIDEGIADLERLVEEADNGVWKDAFMHSAVLMHLSHLYDMAGRYDEAFLAAKRGGEMRQTGYDPEAETATCDDRIRVWSQETMDSSARSRVKGEKLVFIIGMPRSGTSLIEQIIASHPLGYGGGELSDMYHASRELGEPNAHQPMREDVVAGIQRAGLDRCARKMVKSMEKTAGKNEVGVAYARITDKLPSNYELAGMIGLMAPDAKIIHCKRSALDTCMSCFLLDFVGDQNHGYSYDLEHLAHQYKLYERYMEHWKRVSPIEILDVEYEDLVGEPVEGAKRIIEYIGLEWDDRCSRSHETVRAVSTLSSDQVRRPMYTSSVGRWKNYESHIGVLIKGLGISH